ncbi:predicted protein, partial [Nematostella vectensis]
SESLSKELEDLQKEEEELINRLDEVEQERHDVSEALKKEKEISKQLEEAEKAYYTEYCEYQRELLDFEDEKQSVDNQMMYAQAQLDKLKKTNVFNSTGIPYMVRHNGHFGTINNFRLGRLPSVPVSTGPYKKWKHCDGPGGVPEIRGNSTTRNDELLNSLAAAVQTLTAEVQSLKADHASSRQSHSLPPSDVASPSRSSKDVSPRRATTVTLPELRAMDDLADAADRRVAHVLPIASSESDEEADMGALASSPLRKPNKA